MSIEARKECLRAIRERYRKASREEKSAILNEFCEICRYSRKYAIRILRRQAEIRFKRPGPKVYYDLEFVRHLRLVWLAANQMCSSSLKEAIPVYLPHYDEPGVTPEIFFINSLTMTDIFSDWTENQATWTKGQTPILEAIRQIEKILPFEMTGFVCDNGSEFLNYELLKFFRMGRETPIEFTRRRPYKKNDNAHVEQKNWTHVRQLFGYERLEERELVKLMNEIYSEYWNTMNNFFIPSRKLVEKTRIGGRIQKRYDKPKTPYLRLMECLELDAEFKQALQERYRMHNPFNLHEGLKSKLSDYRERVRRLQFRQVG